MTGTEPRRSPPRQSTRSQRRETVRTASVRSLFAGTAGAPAPTQLFASRTCKSKRFIHRSACQNANLNGDGSVDIYDMALFNEYYAKGLRRVDFNGDFVIDALDAAVYIDAYAKSAK
ncbi:MAG: dockerin type I domain-containing protein [Phycisphaerales bacterium JB039]